MVAPAFTPLDADTPRPKDVGVLAMEMYFPRRVSVHWAGKVDPFHICVASVSLKRTSKFLMVLPRANIPLASARNTCRAAMTVKTSTLLL